MKRLSLCLMLLVGCAKQAAGPAPGAGEGKERPRRAGVDPTAALAAYARELARDPQNVTARINLGVMKERQWDSEGAQQEFEDALRADPKNIDAALALGRVLVHLGKAEHAERLLSRLRKQTGDKPELLLALSSVTRARKKYADAVAYGKLVLLRDQTNTDALNQIALAYLADGKLDSAELYTQTALKRADASGLYVTLGLIQLRRGDAQRAMAFFEQAISKDRDDGVAHQNAGFLALQYRDYPTALREIEQAIALGMSGKDLMAARCFALEGMQNGPQAASCLGEMSERLSATDPELPGILYGLGNVHQYLTRDTYKALQAFRRYVAIKGASLSKNDRVLELIKNLEQKTQGADEEGKAKAEVKRPASERTMIRPPQREA